MTSVPTAAGAARPGGFLTFAGERELRGRAFTEARSAAADRRISELLTERRDVALLAVRAYGRAELAPYDGLDVVLVHRRRRDGPAIAEGIWHGLEDAGVPIAHDVWTVGEALEAAHDDLDVMLGLLDTRLVAGDAALADELAHVALDLWRRHAPRWLPVVERQARARHAAAGEVAYLLEPDLMEGRGGLRDVTVLHALDAVGVAGYRRVDLERAASTLLAARVALQRAVGRPEDRLLLELQDPVAAAMGERDADELMADIASSARTVRWVFDDAWTALSPPTRRRAPRTVVVGRGIAVGDDEVVLTDAADPFGDDSLILRLAGASAYAGVPIASAAIEHLVAAAPRMTRPWSEEARDAFVALLGAGDAAIAVVEMLDLFGLWSRVIPEWAAVRCLPQRNAFHRFTVDRHLLETVALATRSTRQVSRPDLLLVGALLHDIGKGFPGDHTDAGVDVTRVLATRMGFPPDDVEALVSVVRNHLLLSGVATGRDLDDPATVDAVAEAVRSPAMLDLLRALTEADSIATGPDAWSPWKAELVDELTRRVRARLTGSAHEPTPPDPGDDALPARYDGTLAVEVGDTHVTVVAPDRPALFASVVGVLALHGHAVRRARARSTADGVAMSWFDVEVVTDPLDAERIRTDVERALVGDLPVDRLLTERTARLRALQRPTAARPAQAVVVFDNDGSANATIVEVRAPDGVGVLYRVAHTLAALGLDIRHATVSTLGHEVIDTFYVVGAGRGKIDTPAEMAAVEEALLRSIA